MSLLQSSFQVSIGELLIANLLAKLAESAQTIQEQKSTNHELELTIHDLANQVEDLEQTKAHYESTIDDLRKNLDQLKQVQLQVQPQVQPQSLSMQLKSEGYFVFGRNNKFNPISMSLSQPQPQPLSQPQPQPQLNFVDMFKKHSLKSCSPYLWKFINPMLSGAFEDHISWKTVHEMTLNGWEQRTGPNGSEFSTILWKTIPFFPLDSQQAEDPISWRGLDLLEQLNKCKLDFEANPDAYEITCDNV